MDINEILYRILVWFQLGTTNEIGVILVSVFVTILIIIALVLVNILCNYLFKKVNQLFK